MTDISKSNLNIILSALEGERRNPNTKDSALKRIARHAERLGLTTDDILTAAAGLLDAADGLSGDTGKRPTIRPRSLRTWPLPSRRRFQATEPTMRSLTMMPAPPTRWRSRRI